MMTDRTRQIFATARRRARISAPPMAPSSVTEAPHCRPVGIIETAHDAGEWCAMPFGLPPDFTAEDLGLVRVVLDDAETVAGQVLANVGGGK